MYLDDAVQVAELCQVGRSQQSGRLGCIIRVDAMLLQLLDYLGLHMRVLRDEVPAVVTA